MQAPFLLPLSALALRRWGLRRVQAALARTVPASQRTLSVSPDLMVVAERLAWCVQVSAAYGPWPANCLQRSVVLWWFLRRRGLSGDVRIGVRRNSETGALEFHAWVEYSGMVINDRRDVRQRYAVFDRPIAPPDATFV